MRKPVIGVMGGSDASQTECAAARELGRLIAERGWVLLTGGRNAGVMAAASAGAKAAGGFVVGVLPGSTDAGASPDLDVAIVTGMGDARNVINVLSSDVVIACAGGAGTLSEIALALKSGKRVILLGEQVDALLSPYSATGRLTAACTPAEAVAHAGEALGRRRDGA